MTTTTGLDRTEKIGDYKYQCSHQVNYVFVMMKSGLWYCQLWKYDERFEKLTMRHVIGSVNMLAQEEWDEYLNEQIAFLCER